MRSLSPFSNSTLPGVTLGFPLEGDAPPPNVAFMFIGAIGASSCFEPSFALPPSAAAFSYAPSGCTDNPRAFRMSWLGTA